MNPNQDNKRLFGFSYKEDELEQLSKLSPVPPNSDDGVSVSAGGLYGYGVEFDQQSSKDYDLIRRYRCMALHPEVDSAIEEVVNEAIVSDTNDTPVAIDLSNLDVSERIKTIIREEFAYILHLLDFNNKCHEMFRRWYIDGRLYYHKVIDLSAPERGITDIRNIDALKVKPVREYKPRNGEDPRFKSVTPPVSQRDSSTFGTGSQYLPARVEEYFLYNKKGINYMGRGHGIAGSHNNQAQTVELTKEDIKYETYGL